MVFARDARAPEFQPSHTLGAARPDATRQQALSSGSSGFPTLLAQARPAGSVAAERAFAIMHLVRADWRRAPPRDLLPAPAAAETMAWPSRTGCSRTIQRPNRGPRQSVVGDDAWRRPTTATTCAALVRPPGSLTRRPSWTTKARRSRTSRARGGAFRRLSSSAPPPASGAAPPRIPADYEDARRCRRAACAVRVWPPPSARRRDRSGRERPVRPAAADTHVSASALCHSGLPALAWPRSGAPRPTRRTRSRRANDNSRRRSHPNGMTRQNGPALV
jgi:hypothetical protein